MTAKRTRPSCRWRTPSRDRFRPQWTHWRPASRCSSPGRSCCRSRFALLVRSGTTGGAIATVATHPHAEAQCRGWLREHLTQAEVVLTNSTAQAAAGVAAREYDAAVAAPLAGERYRLAALSTGIADVPDAVTRFVLLSRPGPRRSRPAVTRRPWSRSSPRTTPAHCCRC
ncbi:MAG: prephenate dehydratase domain-containing protein [Geodermatophilaceae bacterium]